MDEERSPPQDPPTHRLKRGGDDVLGVPHPVLRCCFHPERERVLARKHTPHAAQANLPCKGALARSMHLTHAKHRAHDSSQGKAWVQQGGQTLALIQ